MKIVYCTNCKFNPSVQLKKSLKNSLVNVVSVLGQPKKVEVCINFVDKVQIEKLNGEFRKIARATDVLSFPAFNLKPFEILDSEMLDVFEKASDFYIGDIAICVEQAQVQADEFQEALDDEINRLFVHSLLHLFGFDHIEDQDFVTMHRLEKQILGDKCKD